MDAKKNIIIISSYTLIVCLLFTAGYFAGKHNREPFPNTALNDAAASSWVDDNEEMPYYTLELKNSNIMLYKHFMGDTELIYMKAIMENIYPADDIKELKDGIRFDKLEDAQSLLENFVS